MVVGIEAVAGGVRRHVAAARLWRGDMGMWSAAAVDHRRRQGSKGNNRVGRLQGRQASAARMQPRSGKTQGPGAAM